MQQSLLRPKRAADKCGISIAYLYKLLADGQFPKPIKISERITCFVEAELDDWIAQKIESNRVSMVA